MQTENLQTVGDKYAHLQGDTRFRQDSTFRKPSGCLTRSHCQKRIGKCVQTFPVGELVVG